MIVLDTHAWLWWLAEPAKLSAGARAEIEATDRLGVATISAWEVGMLALRGRIALDRPVAEWVHLALAQPRVEELPLSAAVAVAAALLERDGFQGDPADRIIYATARDSGVRVVSRDPRMAGFDPARVVW